MVEPEAKRQRSATPVKKQDGAVKEQMSSEQWSSVLAEIGAGVRLPPPAAGSGGSMPPLELAVDAGKRKESTPLAADKRLKEASAAGIEAALKKVADAKHKRSL